MCAWVKAQKGHYADGIRKGAIVNPMIVEAGYGGIAPHSYAVCVRLAQRAGGAHAVDRTKYGSTRISTRSYLVHHVQQISKAAVIGDARAILNEAGYSRQAAHVRDDRAGGCDGGTRGVARRPLPVREGTGVPRRRR